MDLELVVGGIALVPIIVGIIEFLKLYAGLPSDKAPLVNAVLTLLAFGLMLYVQANPEIETVVVYVLQAIIVFLSAIGLYEYQKYLRGQS